MTFFNSVVLYLVIWWLSLFIFLLLGITKQKKIKIGNDPGAPQNPMLKKKIVFTSIFSLIIWFVIFLFISRF